MTTLADALSYVVTTLQGSSLCRAVRVLETHIHITSTLTRGTWAIPCSPVIRSTICRSSLTIWPLSLVEHCFYLDNIAFDSPRRGRRGLAGRRAGAKAMPMLHTITISEPVFRLLDQEARRIRLTPSDLAERFFQLQYNK